MSGHAEWSVIGAVLIVVAIGLLAGARKLRHPSRPTRQRSATSRPGAVHTAATVRQRAGAPAVATFGDEGR